MLSEDVKWYIKTCHECQIRQTTKVHIPPTVPIPGGLFRKAHIDTMLMPKANGFRYLIQAHCALTNVNGWAKGYFVVLCTRISGKLCYNIDGWAKGQWAAMDTGGPRVLVGNGNGY